MGPPVPIWTILQREKYLVPSGTGSPDGKVSSLVPMPTTLPRLLKDLCTYALELPVDARIGLQGEQEPDLVRNRYCFTTFTLFMIQSFPLYEEKLS